MLAHLCDPLDLGLEARNSNRQGFDPLHVFLEAFGPLLEYGQPPLDLAEAVA
jgi:hypothetical protein